MNERAHSTTRSVRWWVLAALMAVVLATIAVAYRNATAEPLVRRLVLQVPDYPSGSAPVRIVLVSDLHVHGPDMPPSRVGRIVDQVNALRPDIVIAGGDFIGDNWIGAHYAIEEAIAPLRALKSRFGVYAVLGNNDYDAGAGAVSQALRRAGVRVLVNQAAQAGPIALGGVDGNIRVAHAVWRQRREQTYAALERLTGPKVLIAHRPDEFAWAPAWVNLVLAGHTHCGQIVLPLIGALETGSDFGSRFLCGVIREGTKTLVVTGGVGTSHLPLRLGAPSDIWLISIGGQRVVQ